MTIKTKESLDSIYENPQTSSEKDLLSSGEAAQFLQVSEPTIFRLRRNGRLKYYKVGNKVLFSRQRHLIEFLNNCEKNIEAA